MSESNGTPRQSSGRLDAFKKHLDAHEFASAAAIVRELSGDEQSARASEAGDILVAFVSGLADGLPSAATLIRVYQHLGERFPPDHAVFPALLQKLQQILHVAVPGDDAMTACDALERALDLFASRLGGVDGFSAVQHELRGLRARSRNVIRSHKEQELQALVATGNLEAAIGLCREMIDTGISDLAEGVLPILEREGASPAAVAYILSAANHLAGDQAESVEPVAWEAVPFSPAKRSSDVAPGRQVSRSGRVSRKPWELTFEEVPTPGGMRREPEARGARPAPHEAAWTAPGAAQSPGDDEARRRLREEVAPDGADVSREARAGRAPEPESTAGSEAPGRQPPRPSARRKAVFRPKGRETPSQSRSDDALPGAPRRRRASAAWDGAVTAGAGLMVALRKAWRVPSSRWAAAGVVALVVAGGWWYHVAHGPRPGTETRSGGEPGGPAATPRSPEGAVTSSAKDETASDARVANRIETPGRLDQDVPNPALRPQGPPGVLTLEIVPSDSLELYLNGTLVPDGRVEGRRVPPGKQIVMVYREGYEPLRKELWVDPNAEVSDTLVLSRSPRLALTVTPDVDPEVRLDGRKMWVELPITDVAVPVGKHRLEVVGEGYKVWSKVFEAEAGQNLTFQAQLEPGGG